MTALRAEGCGLPLLAAMLIKSALRDWLSGSDGMISITMMSHLRWLFPPLVPYGTTFPPRWEACHTILRSRATKGKRLYGQARRLTSPDLHILCRMCTVDNKAPQSKPFTQRIAKNKVPPPGGRWWRQPPKGVHFPRPQGGCMVLAAKGGIKYYITPEGESPQPACKAKPITGRTLAAQGRKARRLAQPSRP